jgi:virginiamycin B lyase
MAEYLATINLSAVDKWEYPLKKLPRPSERATRAIVTEYDMKRPTAQPHDVLLDKDGNVWYSDFGELFISKFDPKTLKLTEYPTKEFKPGAPVGNLSSAERRGKIGFQPINGLTDCADATLVSCLRVYVLQCSKCSLAANCFLGSGSLRL